HPLWKVKDHRNALVKQHTGEVFSFEVLPPEVTKNDAPNIFGLVWWLKNIQPRKYLVECTDHSGAAMATTIHVYPLIESSFSFKLEKGKSSGWQKKIDTIRDRLEKVSEWIEKLSPNFKDTELKMLEEGSLSLKNTRAE